MGMKPEWIVAIGGIVALIGGVITVYGGLRVSQQQAEDAKKLYEAQTEGFRQVVEGQRTPWTGDVCRTEQAHQPAIPQSRSRLSCRVKPRDSGLVRRGARTMIHQGRIGLESC